MDRIQASPSTLSAADLETLAAVERRVLWLAVRMIDYANRERPKVDELKVGGHQASSASMVSLMTALYFADLQAADRVSVKPHASPILHAIEYLLGRLDRKYLTTLREFGGLQSYPSRTKDPFPVDYSTGSVGLGPVAPLFGALVDTYVESHFGAGTGGRFISLMGDAELDEGNVWEAVIDTSTRHLSNALWIVDLNRQSLDRVVPIIKSIELQKQFEASGWQVVELKYGRRLRSAFAREGGEQLRRVIDEMPNQVYQGLFSASEEVVLETVLNGVKGGDRTRLAAALEEHRGNVKPLVQDLGGHDLGSLLDAFAFARLETTRPTVLFAYTIKGWSLPMAGRPDNHSALLAGEQIDELRDAWGMTIDNEWDRFAAGTAEAKLVSAAAERLARPPRKQAVRVDIPARITERDGGRNSTQAAFGRALLDASRIPGLAERMVTVSPDVSVSTNLGGWINKVGAFGPLPGEGFDDEGSDAALKWKISPQGQHIELGISEMNLFLILGQLGLTWDYQGEQLFPIGTLYDPFVARGLDGLIYSVYSGSRFIFAGTPAGISLSREGGAHQSTITPGIGMELPGVTYAEPCFARELEWLLLDGLRRLQDPDGEALYLRLSTKPIDQQPFADAVARRGEEAVRADVLAGGFRLRERGGFDDRVVLVTCGAMTPETLRAAELLEEEEGVGATVVCLSSPDRIYRDWREARLAPLRDIAAPRRETHLERLVPAGERGLPVVTVIDGASHSLAFIGGCLGVRTVPLGVDTFGQAGSLADVYEAHDISPEAIATAALIALEG
jgi:pyruvate dehydrogenase E1 component